VVVADRARFPRDKVCAGWLTPAVFRLLELDPADYRAAGLTLQEISAFRTGVVGRALVETRYPGVVSYAIRRCEFDEFLLRRASVRVVEGMAITSLRRNRDAWIVNDAIEARFVIGAGGHFCPVARHLRGRPDTTRPVVAKEVEFRLDADGADRVRPLPELFFCRDLEGYGWCVRKGDYLNIGIGRRDSCRFNDHVDKFVAFLGRSLQCALPPDARWRGHAYLASGTGARTLIGDGMLVVGDAAGLAYPESGEGIKPAIESGRLAADTLVAAGGRCETEALQPYAATLARLHPPVRPGPAWGRAAVVALGRALLASPAFTRHVVLDRWFLRIDKAQSAPG
jgi:flavin-dependent dehydrogenase